MARYFAIIDVETTGGDPKNDKLTEIALVLHDGQRVVDTFHSLINPERSIPPFITRITGINDDMVRYAPRFYEIAKEIVLRTEDAYFVAHNSRFDYNFVCKEFRLLGFNYQRPTLCTVQMSRKAFPGLNSYSLGNLVNHFGIPLEKHHRALDDAMATTALFERIIQSGFFKDNQQFLPGKSVVREMKLPNGITREYLQSAPHTTGVYYMFNKSGDIVYVGKSIDIQNRLWEHFTDMSERGLKLQEIVADVRWEETGSELAALLLENMEIKKHKPFLNKAQRNMHFPYVLILKPDTPELFHIVTQKGYHDEELFIAELKSKKAGVFTIIRILQQLGYASEDTFDDVNLSEIKHIVPYYFKNQAYLLNAFIQDLMGWLTKKNKAFLAIDQGRNDEEVFVVYTKNGKVNHWGYIERSQLNCSAEKIVDALNYHQVPLSDTLLHKQLKAQKGLQILTIHSKSMEPLPNFN
jgi:DNA polymerase-3 subunit epsilon